MYRTSLKLFYVQILSHTRRSENIQRNQINIYTQTKVYIWKGQQMDNKDRGLASLYVEEYRKNIQKWLVTLCSILKTGIRGCRKNKEERGKWWKELLIPLSVGITSSCTIGLFFLLFHLKMCVYVPQCLYASQRITWEYIPSFCHVVPRDQIQVKFGSSTHIHWAIAIRHLKFWFIILVVCVRAGTHVL